MIRRCPVCRQVAHRTTGGNIDRHSDTIGQDTCPMSGEPFELMERRRHPRATFPRPNGAAVPGVPRGNDPSPTRQGSKENTMNTPIHEAEREESRDAITAMTEAERAEYDDPQTYGDLIGAVPR